LNNFRNFAPSFRFISRLFSGGRIGLQIAASVLVCWNANAALQSYPIDLNVAPMSVTRGHLDLGGAGLAGSSIAVNSFYIERNGKPFVPIVGEFHYSRYPANEWEDELRKMKAGGINVVATYVFWNIHERQEGHFDWSGNLDVRRFVEAARKVGLDVILRVGPFGHGEIRNGGLPDWIYGREFEVRSNDPLYLAYCDKLYAAISEQVKGLFFKDGGPIIGIQLENEFQHSAAPWEIRYVDSPVEYTAAERDAKVTHSQIAVSTVKNANADYGKDHMSNLKLIAKRDGLDAPLYTATGWGDSAIVPKGSIPVTSAYPYPYWVKTPPPSPFYLFKDIHKVPDYSPVSYEADLYPSIPAELGVGMSQTYGRRNFVPEECAEPLMVRMLGSGANGLGYYMYHGGATPVFDGVFYNEDTSGLPKIDYDYQAPLGQYGQARSHYFSLRLVNLFLQSYGQEMAPMASILPPDNTDISPSNTDTLRYAARGANGSGFIFLVNYQDHAQTHDLSDLQLKVQDWKRAILIPSSGTFTLKNGMAAILPINLDLGGVRLRSATVQLLTVLHRRDEDYYVFFSIDGLLPELVFDSGVVSDPENCQLAASNGATIVSGPADKSFAFKINEKPILVIPRAIALEAAPIGRETLAFAPSTITSDGSKLILPSVGQTSVDINIYPAIDGLPNVTGAKIERAAPLGGGMTAFRLHFTPVNYSAHWRKITDRRYALNVNSGMGTLNDVYMRVNFAGDTGMAFIDGEMVDDHFYSGRPWEIGLKRFLPQLLESKKEMIFVFHPMTAESTSLQELPADVQLHFTEGQRSYLKVDGVKFIPEYEAILDLSKTIPDR
jgi:beta-galactosidase